MRAGLGSSSLQRTTPFGVGSSSLRRTVDCIGYLQDVAIGGCGLASSARSFAIRDAILEPRQRSLALLELGELDLASLATALYVTARRL